MGLGIGYNIIVALSTLITGECTAVAPVTYPRRPLVGVGCLVLREGRILLVKRAYPPGKGRWSIPGGHVEIGESLLKAAERELKEETGLKGVAVGVVNVDEVITVDERGVRYHYILVTVLIDGVTGDPRPGGDALDAKFYRLDELKGVELTPATRGLISKIEDGKLFLDRPIPVGSYSPKD